MNKREELKKELDEIFYLTSDEADELANFIMQDRKRVVEPLVKYKKRFSKNGYHSHCHEAIDKTLKNAGIDTDK